MRVHHVVPDVAEPASRPSYSVPGLCEAVAGHGHEVELHVLGGDPRHEGRGFAVRTYPATPLLPRKLYWSEPMRRALRRAARDGHVLHAHGMWVMPSLVPYFCVRGTACRLVVSPRGTLDPVEWGYRPLRKRVAWRLGQRANLEGAAALHATAELELARFRALGLRAPVAVIPNGVEVPNDPPAGREVERRKAVLFLARLHPKKGLDLLLRAWQRVQGAHPDWSLSVVGYARDPADHGERMRALARSLRHERVEFVGRVDEDEKLRRFRSAAVYVLPTRGDNWANSIAQALAAGAPVITRRHAPWAGLAERGCGWWIDGTVEALTDTLRDALARPVGELAGMGARAAVDGGRVLVASGWRDDVGAVPVAGRGRGEADLRGGRLGRTLRDVARLRHSGVDDFALLRTSNC